jgi:hypothetical protein
MGGAELQCRFCGVLVAAGPSFCPNCGGALAPVTGPTPPTTLPVAPNESWDWIGTQDTRALPEAQDRTKTGLLLMIIAFALLWIPYVSSLGALLALIGLIFLWLGRNGFGPAHRRNVLLGGVCVVIGLVTGIAVGAWFVDSILTQATPGESPSAIGAIFQSDLGVLFVVGLGTATLTAIAYVALPYALADPTSRILLISAAALTVVISAITIAIIFPQISGAVTQATSGSSINTAPITALEGESALLGSAQFVPYMMFLWAYYRTRTRTFPDHPPVGTPIGSDREFGRTH